MAIIKGFLSLVFFAVIVFVSHVYPQGEKIAFVSNMDGNPDIYTMNENGGDIQRITFDSSSDGSPSWSPDAKRIAFHSRRNLRNWDIYIMNADGSGQQKLTSSKNNSEFPAWSPDGLKIAFGTDQGKRGGICVINIDGSNLRLVTDGPGWNSSQSWSPDCRKIAFNSRQNNNWEISVIDIDGKNQRKLTDGGGNFCPSWSPDGKWIAFSSMRKGSDFIYIMEPTGTNQKPLVSGISTNTISNTITSWSSGGKKIAFDSDFGGRWGIYVMNTDGTGLRKIFSDIHNGWHPAWMPIPQKAKPSVSVEEKKHDIKIVFVSEKEGQKTINIMDRDGANKKTIAKIVGLALPIAVHRDGKVAFIVEEEGAQKIHFWDLINFQTKMIFETSKSRIRAGAGIRMAEGIYGCAWSPDGKKLVCTLTDSVGGLQLCKMLVIDVHSLEIIDLAPPGFLLGNPSWSPSSDKIVFQSNVGSQAELFMVNIDGTGLKRLTDNKYYDGSPAWSPDGKEIAFVSDREEGKANIFIMEVVGEKVRNIETPLAPAHDTRIYWTPYESTGRMILYQQTDSVTYPHYYYLEKSDMYWLPDGMVLNTQTLKIKSDVTGSEIFIHDSNGSNTKNLTNNDYFDQCFGWVKMPKDFQIKELAPKTLPAPPAQSPKFSPILPEKKDLKKDVEKIAKPEKKTELKEVEKIAVPKKETWQERIVFSSDRDGNKEIYIMNVNGVNQINLTQHSSIDLTPCISPDGQWIAFSSDREDSYEIYKMNVSGAGLLKLTNNKFRDSFPNWSSDNQLIAFASDRDGNYEVYVMKADGSDQQRLTKNKAIDISPSWSFQGDRIVFCSYRDGNAEIYSMDKEGSSLKNLTSNPAIDTEPAFSPDGKYIAFVSNRDGGSEIYFMAADGSLVKKVTNDKIAKNNPAWSPNGSKIIFCGRKDAYKKMVIVNTDGSGAQFIQSVSGNDITPFWGIIAE